MGDTFLISDTHFGHEKILEFERKARPFANVDEMNEALIDNWNKVVNHNDTVYHLGDVLFGKANFHLLDRLHGRKKLILGNHDTYGLPLYLEKFREVQAYKKFDDCLFSHVPIHESQFYRFRANFHGHLHSKEVKAIWKGKQTEARDPRYINVSCEQINLTPVSWDVIKDRLNGLEGRDVNR